MPFTTDEKLVYRCPHYEHCYTALFSDDSVVVNTMPTCISKNRVPFLISPSGEGVCELHVNVDEIENRNYLMFMKRSDDINE